MSSVWWNNQYKIQFTTGVFVSIVSSVIGVLLYLFMYPMGETSESATSYYSFCVIAFIVSGFFANLSATFFVKKFGALKLSRRLVLIFAVVGILLFIFTYISSILVVVIFLFCGFIFGLANVSFSILGAEVIDYDELLCGKKRAASYNAFGSPIMSFIGIAGSSIPLALMTSLGYEEQVINRLSTLCNQV